MSVTLREKKNKSYTSLYIDIYENGKRTFITLDECRLIKGNTQAIRDANKQTKELAMQIRNKIALEIDSNRFDLNTYSKIKIDFIEFYENFCSNYIKKDKRVLMASFNKFNAFLKDTDRNSLNAKEVTESLVLEFKEYLEAKLKGETPTNYFKKFKKVITGALRDEIIKKNPIQDVTIRKNESIKKDILTFGEIQLLASTECNNNEVKRAFLFSCFTGLRYSDIIVLKAKDIQNRFLVIKQQKTQNKVSIPLNDNAYSLIESLLNGSDKVIFNLPSHTACLKHLKNWTNKAGISKHITWHCARHTFATNIILFGSDVNSASALLGHSSFTYTQRYVREVDALKEKAVFNLPTIKL